MLRQLTQSEVSGASTGDQDGPAAAHIDVMTQRIADLIQSLVGETMLSKLFWEILDYERVNQPIPTSVLPEAARSEVAECRIFARHEDLPVCYVKLLTSELTAKMQEPILRKMSRSWPAALVVFSNFGGREWDFCWLVDAVDGPRVQRICVDRTLFGPMELARRLYALKAYDIRTDEELPLGLVVAKVDRMFRQTPRARRWRTVLKQSPLWREIGRWELLTAEEEQSLRRRFEAGKPHPARNRLVYANLRLVIDIAKEYRHRGLEWDDIVQEGCIGLTIAADKFDPDRGSRFSTYATYWIRQRIQRAVVEQSSTVRIPSHFAEHVARYRNIWRDSLATRGYRPTPQEIADELGISLKELQIVQRAVAAFMGVRSLEGDCPSRDGDPCAHAIDLDWRNAIHGLVNSLDERLAKIVQLRFGLGDRLEMTLKQIGERLHVTRERIRQLETKALLMLQRMIKSQDVPDSRANEAVSAQIPQSGYRRVRPVWPPILTAELKSQRRGWILQTRSRSQVSRIAKTGIGGATPAPEPHDAHASAEARRSKPVSDHGRASRLVPTRRAKHLLFRATREAADALAIRTIRGDDKCHRTTSSIIVVKR